ncbi:2Fe-2S iron-sulfur cluster binding domain-containing protein [Paraburkholderia sp. CNPSo 3157]|uniref:2Fe-2S iron-sulfur cluster binding domain-containing protein n=1 Tax=Paraburkholderia franconis TaxID=2654983 RepID=A0A7X1NC55_9BURK|nr:PDR/VanB family oxidoreductase [Paraburkholderia franconis]MPW19250.1 2Fe-2S iron-sulfur cluster binding domain-containing protein [Paraburkholderia franconis]
MQSTPRTMMLQIQKIRSVGANVKEYELVCPDVASLPEYEPGAHIDLHIPELGERHYSLVQPWTPQGAYIIAVQSEPMGRGGSRWLHANLAVGSVIEAGLPRNQFRLLEDAKHSVLIAGGIGLTPLLCMAKVLNDRRASFELIVCARDESRLIYAHELLTHGFAQHVHFVLDGNDPDKFLDVRELLQAQSKGTAIYCCGPNTLMDAVRAAGSDYPHLSLHFEAFGAAPASGNAGLKNEPFQVVCQENGMTIDVREDQSLLDALLEAGLDVDHSCKEGYCGTCVTRWVEGDPIHRDSCLSEKQREKYIAVCSGRAARGETIILDI